MASQKNRRRSRKGGPRAAGGAPTPRVSASAGAPKAAAAKPRVAPQTRRAQRDQRQRENARTAAAASRTLGSYGERPQGFFGGLPVSEVAIAAGMVAVVVGLFERSGTALIVGVAVCGLGVLEFSGREHFSGYRSHATLLAAMPAVLVEVLLALLIGDSNQRVLLLVPVIPVFGLSFWLLRRSFATARQARVAKSPRS